MNFAGLANARGLVLMQITQSFAPYDEGAFAGFPPDEAERLFKRDHAIPVDEDGQPIEVTADAPERSEEAPPASSTVEIPEDWKDLHHLQRIRIAKLIDPAAANVTATEADGIIRAEIERRGEA